MSLQQPQYNFAPHARGHEQFRDFIEGFQGLEAGPSFEDKGKYIQDTIKYQIVTGNRDKAARCMDGYDVNLKECFKFSQKRYVQFCLAHKVPGTSLAQAAAELGIRK